MPFIAASTVCVPPTIPPSRLCTNISYLFAKGGETELDNLCYACGGCNGHKYVKTEAIDPADKTTVPLFNPRNQNWDEHFTWADNYLNIVRLTPTGRATVLALQMNRRGVVNIRTLLLMAGKHPPTSS